MTPLKKVAPVVVVQIIRRKSIDFLHPFVRPCVMDGLYKHQPTVEELLVVANRMDLDKSISPLLNSAFDKQLLGAWLERNTVGQPRQLRIAGEPQYG